MSPAGVDVRRAVGDIASYVAACRTLGATVLSPDDISEWFGTEEGLRLDALSADGAALAAAAASAEDALHAAWGALGVLMHAWSGGTGSAATDFLERQCRDAAGVVAGLREASATLETLRGRLARVVADKADSVLRVTDPVAAERGEWLTAAAAVSAGRGDPAATEVVTRRIAPFVQSEIAGDWVPAMRTAGESAVAAYDAAVAVLTSRMPARFESAAVPVRSTAPVAPAPVAPAQMTPAQMTPAQMTPAQMTPVPAAPPGAALPGDAPAPAMAAPVSAMAPVPSGAVGPWAAEPIGPGFFDPPSAFAAGRRGRLPEPKPDLDLDAQPDFEDDLDAQPDFEEDLDQEPDPEPDAGPDSKPAMGSDPVAEPDAGIETESVDPVPAAPLPLLAAELPAPPVEPDPLGPDPMGPGPEQPAPDEPTPCEIAADELPRVGQ